MPPPPPPSAPNASRLQRKIAGVLWGAAAGDALGGPVEGLSFQEIDRRHGRVDAMLPYDRPPMEHAHFTTKAGSYTDDTRLHLITCRALIASGGRPARGDLALAIAEYRERTPAPLARSFIEEYHLSGVYGERKLPFGGHPTNGAIMSNAAVGAVHACAPHDAFRVAFELAYLTDGYAKEAAAIHAAAVASAMRPDATPEGVVHEAFVAADAFRRDGPHWRETVAQQPWAAFEGRPNHLLVERALAVARRERDPFAIREALYPLLQVSPVGSEAGQTLAVALAMLVAADGDYRRAVVGAVNYGRDNDSYATVTGALAGALNGVEAVPAEWRVAVRGANPAPDLDELADDLTGVAVALHRERARTVADVEELLS